jgi:hypothetical protein
MDDLQVLCSEHIEAEFTAKKEALETMSDGDLLGEDCLAELREEEIERRLGCANDP